MAGKDLTYELLLDSKQFLASSKQAQTATQRLTRGTRSFNTTALTSTRNTRNFVGLLRNLGFSVAPMATGKILLLTRSLQGLSGALGSAGLGLAALGPIVAGALAGFFAVKEGIKTIKAKAVERGTNEDLSAFLVRQNKFLTEQNDLWFKRGQLTQEQYRTNRKLLELDSSLTLNQNARKQKTVSSSLVQAQTAYNERNRQADAAAILQNVTGLIKAELAGPEELAVEKIRQQGEAMLADIQKIADAAGVGADPRAVALVEQLTAARIAAAQEKAQGPGKPADATGLGRLGFISGTGSTDYNRRSLSFQERTAIAVEKMHARRDSTMVLNE